MIEGIPLALLNGMGLLGGIVFIFYMVATGRSGTPREIRDFKDTIKWQREHIEELSAQNLTLIRDQSTVVQVLGSIRHPSGEGE